MSEHGDNSELSDPRVGGIPAVLEFLRRHAPFNQMQSEHLSFLVQRLKPAFYTQNDTIASPDNGPASRLCIIREGLVYTDLSADLGQTETWELVPGESFPVAALLSRRAVRSVHRAAEDTVCLELEWADFNQVLELSAEFNDFCTQRLANLLGQMQREVQAGALDQLGTDTSLNITLDQRPQRKPVSCLVETSIREALQAIKGAHVGSIIVTDRDIRPVGVFTLQDLLDRVVLPGVSLEQPIAQVMTPDPVTLPSTAFAFEAAMCMADHGIHHVCVVNQGKLTGVISERDLFTMQRVGLANLSKAICRADSVETLVRLGEDIHQLVDQMIAQGVRVEQITRMITLLNDHIARRIIDLCLAQARDLPAVPFSWLAFGSEGRQEQTLKTDQDNGIVFEAPAGGPSAETIRQALLPVARQINEALDQCGFELCPGNIMASNPECCLSLEEWQQRFQRWIDQGTPEHLLKASIFFDFRVIYGPVEPVEQLRQWLLQRTAKNSRFRRQMAVTALGNRPPLGGLFRDFKLSSGGDHPNTLNLKFNGVAPFVDAARIIALASGATATNTNQRLRQAAEAGALDAGDVAAWSNAYNYIQMLRMRKNQQQRADGQALSNHISPDGLNALDRRILKEAFREARKLQTKLTVDYQL